MNNPEKPLALSIDEAMVLTGIGRTKLFALIRDGAIPARKIGTRTIILRSELEAWLHTLPTVNPA